MNILQLLRYIVLCGKIFELSLTSACVGISWFFSEEIFDYSARDMTSAKIVEMKRNFTKEFTLIFQLCSYILDRASDTTLLIQTLSTLHRFLSWIPVAFMFKTDLIRKLCLKVGSVVLSSSVIAVLLTHECHFSSSTIQSFNFEMLLLHVYVRSPAWRWKIVRFIWPSCWLSRCYLDVF